MRPSMHIEVHARKCRTVVSRRADRIEGIKESGVLIVGYTELMAFYASRRVRVLGLDGLLDYLYSPPDHNLPTNLTPEQLRRFPADVYKFSVMQHRHTPEGELKPKS